MIDFDASEFEIVDPKDIPEYMFLYENTKKRTSYNKTLSDFKTMILVTNLVMQVTL